MGTVTYWDILIIVLYLIAVLSYGLWKARNVTTSDDFLVAGRTLGLFVLIGTLVMTEFNTATMIGFASYGYTGGDDWAHFSHYPYLLHLQATPLW